MTLLYFCIAEKRQRPSLSFNMLDKHLKDETIKPKKFPLIGKRSDKLPTSTAVRYPIMADKCVNLLTLHDSQENSNYLIALDPFCSLTSGRFRPFCS